MGGMVGEQLSSKPDSPSPGRPTARYQPLVIVAAAFCAGIVTDRFFPRGVALWWSVAVGAGIIWLLLRCVSRHRPAAVVLTVAIAAAGASWHHCRWHLFAEDDLGLFATADEGPVCLELVVAEPPLRLPRRERSAFWPLPSQEVTRIAGEAAAIRDGRQWRTASGRTRLIVYGELPQFRPGDRLRVFGQLKAVPPAMNPGQFDFARHLRAERVLCQLRTACPEAVQRRATGGAWSVRAWLAAVRTHSARLLRRYLGPSQAELASVVLLGRREAAPWERREAFAETGTAHLLVVSGLHLGIVAGSLLWLLLRLPVSRQTAAAVVALAAVAYLLLVDARAPVVRATVLVLVGCVAIACYRRAFSFNSLAMAALVVVVWSPVEVFSLGAQLSFLSIAALMWAGPRWAHCWRDADPLDQLLAQSRPLPVRIIRALALRARDVTIMSTVVWLVTIPLVAARTHMVPLAGLALNTVLWIPFSAALLAGYATLLLGSLAVPLAWPTAWVCSACLQVTEWTVRWARGWPLSHFWVPGPPDWWLAGYYGLLVLWLAFPRLRPPRRWCVASMAAWVGLGFLPALVRDHSSQLQATFIAVDHGCSVLVELPDGKALLYDAGRLGSPEVGADLIAGVIWSRGRTHLDAVVLSHADMDHYNALPELLERFSVGVVYVSPLMFDEQSPALRQLRESIARASVPLRILSAGDRLSGGADCTIHVLHPPRRGALGDDNANSLVLCVEYGERRMLLPGDLADVGLAHLLAEEPHPCDVLLAPHHGSRSSNLPGLIHWCRGPTGQPAQTKRRLHVIISGSRRWDPRPVIAAYEQAGCQVHHTAYQGAITVRWPDRASSRATAGGLFTYRTARP